LKKSSRTEIYHEKVGVGGGGEVAKIPRRDFSLTIFLSEVEIISGSFKFVAEFQISNCHWVGGLSRKGLFHHQFIVKRLKKNTKSLVGNGGRNTIMEL
jgi:hypothetical protein